MLGDMSQTERIRFLRNRTLAIWKRTAGTRPEQGPSGSGTDDSVRISRSLGQRTYIRQLSGGCGSGPTTEEIPPPCCN